MRLNDGPNSCNSILLPLRRTLQLLILNDQKISSLTNIWAVSGPPPHRGGREGPLYSYGDSYGFTPDSLLMQQLLNIIVVTINTVQHY